MRTLNIAFPYYQNAGVLRAHLRAWLAYPPKIRDRMTVTIADDGSPTKPAAAAIPKDCPIDIRIYRIGVNLPWNQCGARNLAMHHAPDDWVLVTDADHVLEPADAAKLVKMGVGTGHYYIPARRLARNRMPYKRHPNSYYLLRSMFWDTGGCDEDFQGYYGSDSTFRRAIAEIGDRRDISATLTLYQREVIADASTTEWGRKDSPYHVANHPHLRAKRHQLYRPENPLRFPWERVR